jgi:dCTP deaminase
MTTIANAEPGARPATTDGSAEHGALASPGVLPSQLLRDAVQRGWIHAGEYRISQHAIQPASIDLRLGDFAWPLRCSFLPDTGSAVEEKVADLAFHKVDLRDGATLERDRPYLVPLIEALRLPATVRAKANPKSSTGRLDIFTRVLTDRNHQFDEIVPGYSGRLYMEIVPRTFAVHVRTGLSLNQLRITSGESRMRDHDLRTLHAEIPLLYTDSLPLQEHEVRIADDGLYLGLDLAGDCNRIVGYRAKRNSRVIELDKIRHYAWRDYWEPVYPEGGGRVVLEPEVFYLLLSKEGACIPPAYAAEMSAYDPTHGELRTHYAGFFDPGFGYDPAHARHGSRAALEVRARDVPFMIEHGERVCKLSFERMAAAPDRLYGREVGSNYQGQMTMLSKHFTEQTAGMAEQLDDAAEAQIPRLFD